MTRIVGQPLPHESATGHVTGAALYTDDLAPRLPGLLHAWPVQSTVAHGWLEQIDTARALAMPGVVRILTAADIPGENDTGAARHDEPLLPRAVAGDPRPELLFHGMAVAWVIAESEEAAKLAAQAVAITATARPAILTIEQAISAEHFHTGLERIRRGEPEAALAAAAHTLEGELAIGGQEHFYLETHASIAYLDESDSMFVHASTQHPTETQDIVARVLGIANSQVVVQQLRMGGGFGGKETQANPYAAIAAIAAQLTRRPVRVRLDRLRDVTLTGKRHPFLGRFRVGFDGEGRLRGLTIALYSDGGYTLDLSAPVLGRAMFHIDSAYHLPAVEVTGRVCATHKVSMTAFRGFGGPQAMVIIEEILDRIARHTGLAADVVRERNLYQPGHTTHYEQHIDDAQRMSEIWRTLKADAQFAERRAEVSAFNAAHRQQKRGLAITPLKFGISFTAKFFNQAGALVHIYRDGSVQVNHGGTEMGQGLHTKVLQIAAESLGVPLSAVRIMATRTDKVPNTSATAASAGSDLNGAAVKNACETLRQRLVAIAAVELDCPVAAVRSEDGFLCGPDGRRISFASVVEHAYFDRIQLSATGFYRTPDLDYDPVRGRGRPFYYFTWGAAVAEVEVDGLTGMYGLRRVDLLQDVGASLSPLVDIGQIEGGFAQGVGWLTQEELVWDAAGKLRTGNASTYKLPSLGECPPIFRTSLLPRAAQPGVVYGSKAVGEPPLMLAISVREALRDAVAAFAPRPSRQPIRLASPATAEQVYWAIEAVRSDGKA